MEIIGLKTRILKEKFDLIREITGALLKNRQKIREGDVLVISSKIVALSQERVVRIADVKPGRRARALAKTRYATGQEDPRFIELILREAEAVFPGSMLTTLKNHVLIPAAGIDRSNAGPGLAILWPKDPWKTARSLWQNLRSRLNIKKLGVVICDSHCQPLRWGTTGLALSWAGFMGVEDARGQKDIFGKKLKLTRKAAADNLACAALLVMGEAGEQIPLALARGAPVTFSNNPPKPNEIFVKPHQCVFSGIYKRACVSPFSLPPAAPTSRPSWMR